MSITVKIEKRHIYFLVLFTCVLFFSGIAFAVAPPNPGHNASSVGPDVFGSATNNINIDYGFPRLIYFARTDSATQYQNGLIWKANPGWNSNFPHINWDYFSGLWISTGNQNKPINIEGGDLVMQTDGKDIRIPNGSLCVDNDGNCDPSVQGMIYVGSKGIMGTDSAKRNVYLVPPNLHTDGEQRVGIGTYSPAYKMDVAGAVNLNKGRTGQALMVDSKQALWFDNNYFSWGYGGNGNFFADPLFIGGVVARAHEGALDVEGNAKVSGTLYVGNHNTVAGNLYAQGYNFFDNHLYLNGGSNILFGATNWDTTSPRIYASNKNLILSAPTAGKQVQVATDLNITTGKGITLGGVKRTDWPGQCINRRSGLIYNYATDNAKDYVYFCTSEYPKIFYCEVIGGDAPDTGDVTDISGYCPNLNGQECPATPGNVNVPVDFQRNNLPLDPKIKEFVKEGNGIQGCWVYDKLHYSKEYKIEIICCK